MRVDENGIVVERESDEIVRRQAEQQSSGDPPDVGSFLWGMLAGTIVMVVIEGVVIYFTWPFLVGALKGWVGAEAMREALS